MTSNYSRGLNTAKIQNCKLHRRILGKMPNALGVIAIAGLTAACGERSQSSEHLFIWAADGDAQQTDFLAVLNADPLSEDYGSVITTLPVGFPSIAHHSEHHMSADGRIFLNGFRSGRSFLVDVNDPAKPSLEKQFTTVGPFSHPHSFERLPNGNVIATLQNGEDGARVTGGVVEFSPEGEPLRWASAADPAYPEVRPYSLAILPEDDLLVTTTTDMWAEQTADAVQFWRLSDLTLHRTMRLPPGPRGDEHLFPAEPRMMPDGETLLVNTFSCGLYQIHDYQSEAPRIEHVYTFEAVDGQYCAFPVLADDYWVQTVPARNGLVVLDLSDPKAPKEINYLDLGAGIMPHWISMEPGGNRIVVTGYGALENRVMVIAIDKNTGALSVDRAFGVDGVVDFGRITWPHGENGGAVPHGAVFSFVDE